MESPLCRLCAAACDTGISLLDPGNKHLARWVITCVDIQIEQQNCPRHVCFRCSCIIHASIEYITKCRETQQIFTSQHESPHTGALSNSPDNCCAAGWLQRKSVRSDCGTFEAGNAQDLATSNESGEENPSRELEFVDCFGIKQEVVDQEQQEDLGWEPYKMNLIPREQYCVNTSEHVTGKATSPTRKKKTKLRPRRAQKGAATHEKTCTTSSFQPNCSEGDKPSDASWNRLSLDAEPVHVCPHCDQIFTVKFALDKHVAQLHSKKTVSSRAKPLARTLTCPKCNAKFGLQGSLLWHMQYCQTGKQLPVKSYKNAENITMYQCTICGRESKHLAHIHKHIRGTHTQEKLYACEICNKSFTCDTILREHLLTHQGATFICTICNSKFKKRENLKRHMNSVHSTVTEVFKCDMCPATFRCKHHRYSHIRAVHGTKQWLCDKCGAVFKCSKNLRQHKSHVHSQNSFLCPKCDYATHAKILLTRHVNRVHPEGPQIQCSLCGKTYKSELYMLVHKKNVHSLGTFACANCAYFTNRRAFLLLHMKKYHCN